MNLFAIGYVNILIKTNMFLQDHNFWGVIHDPLFENLGVIGKFRGSELFCVIITFYLSAHASILKVFE